MTSPARLHSSPHGVAGTLRAARLCAGVELDVLERRSEVSAREIAAIESGGGGAQTVRRLLAALGRWPDGRPISSQPDQALLRRAQAMPLSARLESGIELAEFAGELLGAARR